MMIERITSSYAIGNEKYMMEVVDDSAAQTLSADLDGFDGCSYAA